MNDSLKNLNTNIESYSRDELLELLELKEPSKEEIREKIDFLNNNFFKNNFKIYSFFNEVENKLLNTGLSEENNYIREDILPANLNIETMTNNYDNDDYDNYYNNDNNDNNDYDDNYIVNYTNNYDANKENDKNLIIKDENYVENYNIINYLHFNTIFKSKKEEANDGPTNCNFILSSPINDITHIKLKSINLKMPYLISEKKENNKFLIELYKNNSINFSQVITLDNGYYNTRELLVKNINEKIQYYNTNKSQFYISTSTITSSDISYDYFVINFKKYYTSFYSLADILGFNKKSGNIKSNNNAIDSSYNIESDYCINLNNNNSLFFCFDEFQSNIIETHKLFYNNNMSTNKILAKIDTKTGIESNSFYITDLLEEENTDNIRKYAGTINLNNFSIKIIDYFGNIINEDMKNDNITFTLEIKINRNKLINKD